MKLNKLFLLMLALPLAFGGCKKSEAPKSGSEYLFDVQMSAAERVMEVEGTTFEDNQFMLVFTDASESCMLTIFIQGEAGEKALHAGEYKRALDIESCMFIAEDETVYTFVDGVVNVALEDKVYDIEALFTDAEGGKYRFAYEGKIFMNEDDLYFVNKKMRKAERLTPEALYDIKTGDIGVMFVSEASDYTFAMVFALEDGKDVLTAGMYSTDLGNLRVEEGFYATADGKEVYRFVSGEAKVEGDVDGYSLDFLLYDAEGRSFHITYEGVVSWMMTTFEDAECYARCFGHYEGCESYNYVLWLGRYAGYEQDNNPAKQRFAINIFSPVVEKDSNGYFRVPNGTYTFDAKNSTAEFTISDADTYVEFGKTDAIITDATLEITDEGATLTAKVYRDAQLGGDVEYTMTYKGEILAVQAEEFEE
jgi:hypothetical protein